MLNILVPISDPIGQPLDRGIAIAIDLARALAARLTLIVEGQFALAGGNWAGPGSYAAPADQTLCPLPREIVEALDRRAVQWGWVERPGGWREVSRQVGVGWLLALPASADPGNAGGPSDIEEALIEHRMAVMALPSRQAGFNANGHALVLWDGSREAVHALAAAVPLLRVASRVTLLEIDDGSLSTLGCQALDLLAARGVAATLSYLKASEGQDVASIALDEITARAPDYAVLGGFGRPGWIERLAGDMTVRLIEQSPVPLFLKH